MSSLGSDIRNAYILYIGAGAVAAAGIISVFKSLPMIWHGMKGGMKDVKDVHAETGLVLRTHRDLPLKLVLIGVILLVGDTGRAQQRPGGQLVPRHGRRTASAGSRRGRAPPCRAASGRTGTGRRRRTQCRCRHHGAPAAA